MSVLKIKNITVDAGSFNAAEDSAFQHESLLNNRKYINNKCLILDIDEKFATTSLGESLSVETGKAVAYGVLFHNEITRVITPDMPSTDLKGMLCLTVNTLESATNRQYLECVNGTATNAPAPIQQDLRNGGTKFQIPLYHYDLDVNGVITNLVDVRPNNMTVPSDITFVSFVDGIPPDEIGNIQLDTRLAVGAKAVDSELLDGLDSTKFLRSDVAGTASGKITLTGGLEINNADFKIMNISAPISTTDHEVLITDDSTGQVYRETQANMNVGYATNAGSLDGLDKTAFAPSDFAVSTPLYTGSASMNATIPLSESIYNFSRADINYATINCYCGVSSGTNIVTGNVSRSWGGNGVQLTAGCSIISADGRSLTTYGENHSRQIVLRGGMVNDATIEGNIGSVYGMFRKYAPATAWTIEQEGSQYFRIGRLNGDILEKVEIDEAQYIMTMELTGVVDNMQDVETI